MAVDYADFQKTMAKRVPKPPDVIIRTVDSSAAWQHLRGWVDDQIKVLQSNKAMILERYATDAPGNFETMVRQKHLLDNTQAEMLAYQRVAEYMQQCHPIEP
ncbi:MAG: hypothetical protein KC587_11165 [Nitrospira sp.]|nr:hypothetical protein [Nitrospira sp.]